MSDSNRQSSEMWISITDAVERCGVSRGNIMEWVNSGQIKKEKKKGVVYLWIKDLVRLTPISGGASDPEVLPLSEGSGMPYSTLPSRQMAEQIREGVKLQSEILAKVKSVEVSLSQASSRQLDPQTTKELSHLGNVFRSIHQQNEKVSLSLAKQEQLIHDVGAFTRREEKLQDQLISTEKRKTIVYFWLSALIILIVAGGLLALRELQRENQNMQSELEKDQKAHELVLENLKNQSEEKAELSKRLQSDLKSDLDHERERNEKQMSGLQDLIRIQEEKSTELLLDLNQRHDTKLKESFELHNQNVEKLEAERQLEVQKHHEQMSGLNGQLLELSRELKEQKDKAVEEEGSERRKEE